MDAVVDAIVLAGGKGTRLQSILPDIPKPLAPINGEPFLDILLEHLNRFSSIKKVILAVGYKAEMIMHRYLKSACYRFPIAFSEEKVLLGTGGGVKRALDLTDTSDVLVLNGDTFVEIDIDTLLAFHRERSASVTIVLREVEEAGRYGSITIDGESRIIKFEEKVAQGKAHLINAGVYVIDRKLLNTIDKDREISLERQLLPEWTKYNSYGFIVTGKFIDIGIPETYKKASSYLERGCS
jgi:D-glycero-alpha-D-manno-heptose 1-phosphate guanylyltransferase